MISLPKGITDFGHPEINEEISELEFKQFCYDLLAEFGYHQFSSIRTYSGNYRIGRLSNKDDFIHVIMNKYYPFVGLADKYEGGNVSYIDYQDMRAYINAKSRLINIASKYPFYSCLGVIELEAEVTDETIKLLDKEEISQLQYWKPAMIKDIIFNNWD